MRWHEVGFNMSPNLLNSVILTIVFPFFKKKFYSKVSRDTLYEAVKEVLQGSVAKPRK